MEKNTEPQETAVIEGPYWDYIGASDYAHKNVNMYARLIADNFIQGNIERAQFHVENYEKFKALKDRITDRYDNTHGNEETTWIGWR